MTAGKFTRIVSALAAVSALAPAAAGAKSYKWTPNGEEIPADSVL